MLHFRSVAFAHRSADFARLDAGPQLRAGQFEIRPRETRDHARRGETDVRAIVIVADTFDEICHLLFPQAGIGAGIARFRAGVTGRDAFEHNSVIRRGIYRMRVEHLFDVAHKKVLRCLYSRIAAVVRAAGI